MKKITICLLLLTVVLGVAAFSGTATGHTDKVADGIEPRSANASVLISVESDTIPARTANNTDAVQAAISASQTPVIEHLNDQEGVTVRNTFWISNTIQATIDTSKTPLTAVAAHDDITHVAADRVIEQSPPPEGDRLQTTQHHTLGEYTYGLTQIDAPTAWERFNVSGEGVNVTVIDTGVSTVHPDITLNDGRAANNYAGGWAVFNRSTDTEGGYENFEGPTAPPPQDDGPSGHGTHVSGTVVGGNATGTHIGVAPNATLQHALVFDYYSSGTVFGASRSDTIRAIEWAITNDADIISLSLGSTAYDGQYIDPIDNARASGVVVLAAAGNEGDGTTITPGAVANATAVGASTEAGGIASFSSGERYDPEDKFGAAASEWDDSLVTPYVAAPGDDIYSADETGSDLTGKSGTSMATPHVAGATALLLDNNPTLTPTQVDRVLRAGAVHPDGYTTRNTRSGYGIINVTTSLTHSEPNGYLTVANGSVNATTVTGDPLVATVNVTNLNLVGDAAARNVTFSVNGSVVDHEEIVVDAGGVQELAFNYTTTEADVGTLDSSIATGNVTRAYTTQVGDAARFSVLVNASTLNDTIVAHRPETVAVGVTNDGGLPGSEAIEFAVNGTLNGTETVTDLGGGDTATVEFSFTPEEGVSPVRLTANSTTDSATLVRPVTTLAPITITPTAPAIVTQGGTIHLGATYNITTGINRTITPVIERDGTVVYTGPQTVLNATTDNSTTVATNVTLPSQLTGTATYNFTTHNAYNTPETAAETVAIDNGPVYSVDQYTPDFKRGAVDAVIENKGSTGAAGTINVTQDGRVIGSTVVRIQPGQSKKITVAIVVTAEGTGELAVVTPQRQVSRQVAFEKPTPEPTSNANTGGSGAGGQAGGGQGGGAASGGGSGPDTSPPTPRDVKDMLNFATPRTEATLNQPGGAATSDESATGSNAVESVRFSGGVDTAVAVRNYGDPPRVLEEELINSIAIYQPEVRAATPEEIEWDADGVRELSQEESTAETAGAERARAGSDIDVLALSEITPEQEIDETGTTASVTIAVDGETVADPEQLRVYKEEYVFAAQAEQWIELDISRIESTDGILRVTAETDEFSLFAVAAVERETPVETEAATSNESRNESREATAADAPGFGVMTALVSIMLLVAVGRRYG